MDSSTGGHSPIGILSSQSSSISNIGTSINQTISSAIKAKKQSIFRFSSKKGAVGVENMDFSGSPFLNVEQNDYSSQNAK
jgi:hypothetical protein